MARIKIEDWLTESSLQRIESWARRGLTNEQISQNIGISSRTLNNWTKKQFPIFQALKKGREVLDYELENALVKKALGYEENRAEVVEETKEMEGTTLKQVKIVSKAYPPDTGALIFLLKNRLRNLYQDRPKTDEELESLQLDNELKALELKRELELENGDKNYHFAGIPAHMIAPVFAQLHFDVLNHKYQEFVLPGGRGSTKSSFISLEIINLIENNPNMHALVCRQVDKDLKDTVFNQLIWAFRELGLESEYRFTFRPLEITKKSTGQKIYFTGLSDPKSLKSFKTPFGYTGILWFEEIDQIAGDKTIRDVEQTIIRGGEEFYEFKSFNPPKSKLNWANKYILLDKPGMKVYHSTYLDVPPEWLGEPFLQLAEFQKQNNPDAYLNEYMGEANGSGANVFPNLVLREITDEEIQTFDDFISGVDFGWVHPSAFIRAYYNPARQKLVVIDEAGGSYMTNENLAKTIKEHGVNRDELVICDSEEPKGINDLQECGLQAVKAKKGPGSRGYGYKWLASQIEIVADPKRTPRFVEQAIALEYERDKEGNITSMIPKINDDWTDALIYATEPLRNWRYDPFD